MIMLNVRVSMQAKAYRLAARYEAFEGVQVRLAVDRVFTNGEGFLVLECDDDETAQLIESELESDTDVASYS